MTATPPSGAARSTSWALPIVAEDLDADGDVDLAAAGDDNVALLYNTGAGDFANTSTGYLGGEVLGLVASDIDRDDDMDLLIPLDVVPKRIEFLRNVGGEDGFDPLPLFIGGPAYDMTAGDLDGDQDDDFLTIRYEGEGEAVVVRNDSTLRMHDCNLNSVLDVCETAAGEAEDCNTNLVPDECDAAPLIEFVHAADLLDEYISGIINVDVDGDLDMDLVAADGYETVSVFVNNGNAVFANAVMYDTGGYSPADLVSGDFDGDSDQDLVVATYDPGFFLLLNDGLGAFTTSVAIPDAQGYRLVAADLNGDGDLDLAFLAYQPARIGVCSNDGAGGFSAPKFYTLPDLDYAGSLAAGDLDSDGDLDLAATNSDEPGVVHVFLNSGPASFSLSESVSVGDDAYWVITADLDGDGDMDIITTNADDHATISILFNGGDATFAPAVHHALGDYTNALSASDFDSDSRPDLAFSIGDAELAVMLNEGDGTFWPLQRIAVPGSVHAMTAGDFNGDAASDIAMGVENSTGYGLSVFLHQGVVIRDADSDGVPDECQDLPGDLNCDGAIDAADLPLFVQALLVADDFAGCDISRADLNEDGVPDGDDVQLFLYALLQP